MTVLYVRVRVRTRTYVTSIRTWIRAHLGDSCSDIIENHRDISLTHQGSESLPYQSRDRSNSMQINVTTLLCRVGNLETSSSLLYETTLSIHRKFLSKCWESRSYLDLHRSQRPPEDWNWLGKSLSCSAFDRDMMLFSSSCACVNNIREGVTSSSRILEEVDLRIGGEGSSGGKLSLR